MTRWVAALACGHEFRVPPLGLPPRVGQSVSCPVPGCRRQSAVAVVTQLEGGEAARWLQEALL